MPFRCGILNHELFASIDDDTPELGYSLISRGKYPERKTRTDIGLSGNVRPLPNKKLFILKKKFLGILQVIRSNLPFQNIINHITLYTKQKNTKYKHVKCFIIVFWQYQRIMITQCRKNSN